MRWEVLAGVAAACGVLCAEPIVKSGRLPAYEGIRVLSDAGASVSRKGEPALNPPQTVATLAAIFPDAGEWGLRHLPACSAMTTLNPMANGEEELEFAQSWQAEESSGVAPSKTRLWLAGITKWRLLRYKVWILIAGLVFCIPRMVPVLVNAQPRDVDLDPEFLM